MRKIFYNDVATRIIMSINKPKNISRITKDAKSTYAHVVNVIQILEEKKLLIRNKIGREAIVELTEKGIHLRQLLMEIQTLT